MNEKQQWITFTFSLIYCIYPLFSLPPSPSLFHTHFFPFHSSSLPSSLLLLVCIIFPSFNSTILSFPSPLLSSFPSPPSPPFSSLFLPFSPFPSLPLPSLSLPPFLFLPSLFFSSLPFPPLPFSSHPFPFPHLSFLLSSLSPPFPFLPSPSISLSFIPFPLFPSSLLLSLPFPLSLSLLSSSSSSSSFFNFSSFLSISYSFLLFEGLALVIVTELMVSAQVDRDHLKSIPSQD